MPSDEELWDSVAPMVDFDHGDTRAMEGVKLLIERAALKAQIEALCSISGKDVIEIGVAIGDRLDALYARLAELEAKP